LIQLFLPIYSRSIDRLQKDSLDSNQKSLASQIFEKLHRFFQQSFNLCNRFLFSLIKRFHILLSFSKVLRRISFPKKLFLLFFILFLIEINFPSRIYPFFILPDLFFILIFFLSLYRQKDIFFLGVSLGFLRDLISISNFCLNTIIFGFWSYSLPKIFKRFYKESIFLQLSILALCIWINSTVFMFFRRQILFSTFFTITSLESLYGVFIYCLVFRLLKKFVV